MQYVHVCNQCNVDGYSHQISLVEWFCVFLLYIQTHTPKKTIAKTTKTNPVIVEMITLNRMVWFWSVPTLEVVETVVGASSIWHSDWVSAGTNRSHSKSTAYAMLFKKRTGSDRYHSLRAVYSCCVWAASRVLMVPENTVAPSTSLLQNE